MISFPISTRFQRASRFFCRSSELSLLKSTLVLLLPLSIVELWRIRQWNPMGWIIWTKGSYKSDCVPPCFMGCLLTLGPRPALPQFALRFYIPLVKSLLLRQKSRSQKHLNEHRLIEALSLAMLSQLSLLLLVQICSSSNMMAIMRLSTIGA